MGKAAIAEFCPKIFSPFRQSRFFAAPASSGSRWIMARIVAQIYNWWALFVRWIDKDQHREAVTSRPLMLHGVAREVRLARQVTLNLTPMHGKWREIKQHIGLITNFLNKIKTYAERLLSKANMWRLILSEIFSNFIKGRILGEGNTRKIEQTDIASPSSAAQLKYDSEKDSPPCYIPT
ncbi:MAG: hypothetical protein HW387_1796, partial [Parachlamydiales bacterium]|nr:hypothetical protein [Parachlamydiales bacterium]